MVWQAVVSQTRGNGNISHDESQNVASGQQEVCAVGRPFGRFGKPSGRSSFFVSNTSELALRQVLLLCPQDKRTLRQVLLLWPQDFRRTGSPTIPPSLAPKSEQVFSKSLILSPNP